MRPDISGDCALERDRRPAGNGAPDLKGKSKDYARNHDNKPDLLQEAEITAARHVARKYHLRPSVARLVVRELRMSMGAL